MTEAFMDDCRRVGFGPPIPVADSLRALSEQSIWTLNVTRESDTLDVENPRTLMDSVMSKQLYALPTHAELILALQNISVNARSAFVSSETYREFLNAWQLGTKKKFGDGARDIQSISATMITALGVTKGIPTLFVASAVDQGQIIFSGLSSTTVQKQPWVEDITPMLFVWQITTLLRHSESDSEPLTIGEVLHAVSRFPNVFRHSVIDEYTLGRARKALLPLAGEAWLSYFMLAVKSFEVNGLQSRDAIGTAREFIQLGRSVEELQAYVYALGVEPTLIRLVLENNLDWDMLTSIAC